MVFGTFDILHLGHIHLFTKAREYGDHLVACVASDNNAMRAKKKELFHNQKQRAELLSHVDVVDTVVDGYPDDPYKVIREVAPDVIALGYDQRMFVDNLADELTKAGLSTQIVRIPALNDEQFKSTNMRKYIRTQT